MGIHFCPVFLGLCHYCEKDSMKTLLFSFAAGVSADMALLESSFGDVFTAPSINRNANDTFARQMNNYGCWCYFDAENTGQYHLAKGEPQDDYDRACKRYNLGMECVAMDHALASVACSPYSVTYNMPVGVKESASASGTPVDIIAACNALNVGDTCAQQTCIVEQHLVYDVSELTLTTQPIVTQFHAANFPVETACVVRPGTAGEKECCGSFPNRYPFKPLGGIRECCPDGSVTASTC